MCVVQLIVRTMIELCVYVASYSNTIKIKTPLYNGVF